MIRRITGLKQGPPQLGVFGGEIVQVRTTVSVGDEVRCRKREREIYIIVLSVSDNARSLLGRVKSLAEWKGYSSLEVHVGDLVEFPSDRILALLPGSDCVPDELREEPLRRQA
jgi:hypothetical protein